MTAGDDSLDESRWSPPTDPEAVLAARKRMANATEVYLLNAAVLANSFALRPLLSEEACLSMQQGRAFISVKERISIADWMAQFCGQFCLSRATYAKALACFDRIIDTEHKRGHTTKN